MDDRFLFSLLVGGVIGAVVASKYKPARDMVNKGVEAVENQVSSMQKNMQ